MNNILIDIVEYKNNQYFCVSGSFLEITKNSRLITSLGRLNANENDKYFYIPFSEELKINVLQKIQNIFTRHNFTHEICPELKLDVESFIREEESFLEFAKEAAMIRNDNFEDNSIISEKFQAFKELYTKKLKPINRKLFPIQELSAFHMAFSQNSCNFAVPGAGKTSIVYGAYSYLNSLPQDDPKHVDNLLVVGPLSSFQPWKDEYKECFGVEPECFSLSGNSDITKDNKTDYLYSASPKELTLIFHGSVGTYQTEIIHFLKNNKTMVVVDEAHRIKSPVKKWGRSVTKISENAISRVVLTGTPTPNGYQDIYNLYKFIYPFKYREIIQFKYQDLEEFSSNPDLEVPEIEKLKKNLEPFFIRIKKQDLEKHMNLPEVINHPPINVDMDSEQRSIYDFIFDKYVPLFKQKSTASAKDIFNRARLIRLRQAATNPSLLLKSLDQCLQGPDSDSDSDEDMDYNSKFVNEGENFLSDSDIIQQIKRYSSNETPRKFIETVNLINNEIFPRNEKVIIWTIFIQNSKELQKYLSDLKIESKLLIGEVSLEERVSIIKNFNDPENMEFQVVIANPFSVSESISLHKGCRNAIYLERDYNCAMFLQSRDRIHRVGLTKDQKPHFYYLISKDSIDEVIDNRLQKKIERMEKLINDDIPLFGRLDDNNETALIEGLLDQYLLSINDKRASKV
jgi:SNF2 family DNA or RNA helicase